MPKWKLTTDGNGNRCLRFSPGKGRRGFSIQTNGNLPEVHREAMTRKNGKFTPDAVQVDEVLQYINDYGTEKQKAAIKRN